MRLVNTLRRQISTMAERLSFDKFHNIIDGKPRSADKFHQGVDPSTGEKLWDVPIATQQDVDDAVASAEKAFKTWSKTPVEERKKMISKFDELYRNYEKEFTELMCKETGKPRMFANGEVKGGSSQLQWHAKLDIPTDTFEDKQKKVFTTYKPVGVCVGLLPWNFPIFLSVGKIAPALLTGCTMIVKPSPYTPFTSLKIVELAQQVFPPGVLQAVGGDDSLGPMFTAHPGVQKITFTGSIATGKKIYAACAKTLKRITLELGGNDPCIVCPDIDMDKQLSEVMMGAFFNSGQVCVASKRIYVHKDIYDTFLQKMIEFTKGMKVGSSDEPKVMVGPMQNSMQYDKVLDFFKDSREKGYKFAVGEAEPKKGKGFFINPTIIDNPPNDSMIITEEPFGPIVPVQPWSDEDEVIARANSTNTGLSATVFGKDEARCLRIADRIESGSVYVNSFSKPEARFFFGGVKESGVGGEWGKEGIMGYLNAHVVHQYKL